MIPCPDGNTTSLAHRSRVARGGSPFDHPSRLRFAARLNSSVRPQTMNSYHGTDSTTASTISNGGVDVTLGGGELGRGFYTGEHLHEAKAWAFHRYGEKKDNVVKFEIADATVEGLTFHVFNHGEAGLWRYHIKQADSTRTHTFNVDLVWAPIVGSERAAGDQFKWESKVSETLLNDKSTLKCVL